MENQNRNMEQEVWQRVRGNREEAQGNPLRQLQKEAMELAGIYRNLTAQLGGNPRERMKQLYTGERANASALAGIGFLSRQEGESLKLWQPVKEDLRKQLQRCYYRTRRCMTEYLAWSAEGEYGVVFDKLAKREAEHCALIAEILGSLG